MSGISGMRFLMRERLGDVGCWGIDGNWGMSGLVEVEENKVGAWFC